MWILNPHTKMRNMIKDLIVCLVAEAHEEAERKDWRDVELATNEQTYKEIDTPEARTLKARVQARGARARRMGRATTRST